MCTDLIRNAKISYIKKSNVLNHKRTDPKVYWTILNNVLNNIKINSVPQIFISGETITSIIENENFLYEFFAFQCTPLQNNSKLFSFLINIDKRLNTISIKKTNIASIIKLLNRAKARGFDKISIGMIQLCGNSITLPLTQNFTSSLRQSVFPDAWKMTNIIFIQKKEEKYYYTTDQLVVFQLSEFLKKLLFSSFFSHFYNYNLFTKYQSGVMPGDSFISQLLSIVHEIRVSFYYKTPIGIRVIFLDTSKSLIQCVIKVHQLN